MTKTAPPKITASDVVKLFREKFAGDAYAVFEQVSNGTGFHTYKSYIDLVVVSLWPSRGLTRTAIEIKVDRADYLREIKNPHKNQWARDMMDEFYYAAPKSVIHHIDEIPDGRGWYEVQKGRVVVRKIAPRNPAAQMDNLLMAALARAAIKYAEGNIKDAREKIFRDDPEIVRYKAIDEGVRLFNNERTGRSLVGTGESNTPEKVLTLLRECSQDKELKVKLTQFEDVINRFQRSLVDSWQLMTAITVTGLGTVHDAENDALTILSGWKLGSIQKIIDKAKSEKYREYYNSPVHTLNTLRSIIELGEQSIAKMKADLSDFNPPPESPDHE